MTTAHNPAGKVEVIGLALALALWGSSLPMFCWTIYILCRRRPFSATNCANVIVACLLFIISTIRVIDSAKFTLEKFFRLHDHSPGIPKAMQKSFHQETLVSSVTYGLQTMLGDAVVIYRCYVVWQSPRIIAVPVLLWCGTIATFIGGIFYMARMTISQNTLFTSGAGRCVVAFFYLTLLTNLISTGLLAYRIRAIHGTIPRSPTSMMRSTIYPIMLVIIDAGILYSALLLTAIILLCLKSSFTFAMADIIVPTISIIFYLVIMRIAAAKSSLQSPTTAHPSGSYSTNAGPQMTSVDPVASARPLPEDNEHPIRNSSPDDRV